MTDLLTRIQDANVTTSPDILMSLLDECRTAILDLQEKLGTEKLETEEVTK